MKNIFAIRVHVFVTYELPRIFPGISRTSRNTMNCIKRKLVLILRATRSQLVKLTLEASIPWNSLAIYLVGLWAVGDCMQISRDHNNIANQARNAALRARGSASQRGLMRLGANGWFY